MNHPHDTPAATASAATPNPNGQTTLSDRVRARRLKGSGSAAPPRSTWLPWGLTVIALAAAGIFAWRAYRLSPDSPSTSASDTTGAGNASARTADPSGNSNASTGEVTLDNKGIVVAPHQIQISPQVGGEIVWLDPDFREGAVYQKGDPLAVVDPVIYRAQLKNARAALEVAKVNLEQVKTGSTLKDVAGAKALLNNLVAKLEWTRVDERNKRRAGFGTSNDDLEKATIQLQMDDAARENQKHIVDKLEALLSEQRRTAEAQVEAAKANVEQAEKQLRNCTILAPTTGIVLSKEAELGGYVNPLAYSGVAGSLCKMADLLDLEIDCDIPERDFKAVKVGQRCSVMPDAGRYDEEGFKKTHPGGYEGVLARRLPIANQGKGAVKVRVRVIFPKDEKGGDFLIPDMGALVKFMK
jgi:multidrug resistance efflux pump